MPVVSAIMCLEGTVRHDCDDSSENYIKAVPVNCTEKYGEFGHTDECYSTVTTGRAGTGCKNTELGCGSSWWYDYSQPNTYCHHSGEPGVYTTGGDDQISCCDTDECNNDSSSAPAPITVQAVMTGVGITLGSIIGISILIACVHKCCVEKDPGGAMEMAGQMASDFAEGASRNMYTISYRRAT